MSVRILHCKWQILSSDWLKHIKKIIYFHTWFESPSVLVSGWVGLLCSNNVIRTQFHCLLFYSPLCWFLSQGVFTHGSKKISSLSELLFLSAQQPHWEEFLFPNNSGESSGTGFNWTDFFMCPSVTQALWLGRHMDYANLSLRGRTSSIQPSQTAIGGGIAQRKIWALVVKWLGMMLGSQNKNFSYIFVTESLLNSGHKHLLWLMPLF